jgi:hypothetical protein
VGLCDRARQLDGPGDWLVLRDAPPADEAADAAQHAGPVVRDEPRELALVRLAKQVGVTLVGDCQVGMGVVHAHQTEGGATIFPRMHKDYSQTPLPKKLGIKEGSRVALQGAPQGFAEAIGVSPRTRGKLDVVVVFATRQGELIRHFPVLARRLEPDGGLWVAWPKKAGKVETDLSFEAVQKVGLDAGLVDNKSCSIDETWQALRFVYRLADRPASSSKRSA